MNPEDTAHLRALREETLEQLTPLIDPSRPVALLDFPGHTNVGDHMIFAGQLAYLRKLGAEVAYLADIQRFDPNLLRRRMPVGTILIQGGGNVGDTWPEHHGFKEMLAREFPDYPIVQLPQTVYFASPDNAERANQIFANHGRFTLMVRDTASHERAGRDLPDVTAVLAPDMALGWSPATPSAPDRPTTIVLCRTDRESTNQLSGAISPFLRDDDHVTDWAMDQLGTFEYRLGKAPGKLSNGRFAEAKRKLFYPIISRSLDLIVDANLRNGQRQLAAGSVVVTDRLHAHILATLMGIPNIIVENSYGKMEPIYRDYMARFSTSNFVRNEDELRALYPCLAGVSPA